MQKKRPYKRKTTVKRTRSPMTVRRKRKPKENKFLQTLAKVLRLLILFAICAFIIFHLLKTDLGKDDQVTSTVIEKQIAADSIDQVISHVEQAVDIDTLPKAEALDYLLNKIFNSYHIEDSWIKRNAKSVKVKLPPELPALTIIYDIIQKANELDLKYINSVENLRNGKSSVTLVNKNDTLLTISFYPGENIQRKTGEIAIIIDDFGYYNDKTTDKFLELNYPVTLSILPGQKYSNKIARKAKQYEKDIMLHLPMEPLQEQVEQNDYSIMTKMSDSEIAERVRKALKFLPDAIGVNNHMGSKATADERVMDIVLRELKAKDLIFIDSKTTLQSVAPKIAKKYNLKFAQNATFLERDKNERKNYIRSKLKTATKIAERNGRVVVIGHPYQETIDVLTEELPKLEKHGFLIIPISKLFE